MEAGLSIRQVEVFLVRDYATAATRFGVEILLPGEAIARIER